ncbi:MAG: divalent-cation tolerance protein CutA [Candidatus Omnitrophota bacterium]
MEKLCLVYITASNRQEAENIGEKIVSSKLAACANISDSLSSFYCWDGQMQNDTEAVLVLKTKESLLEKVRAAVKELHSYECPCFLAIPVIYADKQYAEWMLRNMTNDGCD